MVMERCCAVAISDARPSLHCGADFTITEPSECGAILDEAPATPGPVIVDAIVDPFEPPMPPYATLEQAFELSNALARGTTDGGKIIATILEDKVKEMV